MRYFWLIFVLLVTLPLGAQTPSATPPPPPTVTEIIPAPAPAPVPAVAPAPVAPEVIETPVIADPAPASAKDPDAVQQIPDTATNIPIPQNVEEAGAQVEGAIGAFQMGQYVVGILLLLGVILFVWRKFGKKKGETKEGENK